MKKTKPPKAIPSHSFPLFPLLPSFCYKPSPPLKTHKQSLRLCLGFRRGGEGRGGEEMAWGDRKYRGKW